MFTSIRVFLLNAIFITSFFAVFSVIGQNTNEAIRRSELVRDIVSPQRIVFVSDSTVINANAILKTSISQAVLSKEKGLTMTSKNGDLPIIILDFGKQIQGGIEIVTTMSNKNPMPRVRVRFGESVSETLSNIGENGATNDHALRDFETALPWLGRIELGNTGFRFVSVQLVDSNAKLDIKEINAISEYRDIPYLGSFRSNDERLNKIWEVGAYTVHLNMQEYLWDGIKRDRLVWVGDLHPEVMTINAVFGYNNVIPKSLDLIRDITKLPSWMNGISSYSMWWVIIHNDFYKYHGDIAYLAAQKDYLLKLLKQLASKIDENGVEKLDGIRFLDWPSNANKEAVHAGLQSLLRMTFLAGIEIGQSIKSPEIINVSTKSIELLDKYSPKPIASKQAAALLALSGLMDADKANDILKEGGTKNFSTFYGYYMLRAKALAGDVTGAMNDIRTYWGGMLDLGATSFWEDFDIDWLKNAGRIDEMPTADKVDVHATYGDHCYVGFRHSFCHGWASGPTAWLSEYVLGVQILEPGCKRVRIKPNLGDLQWVEGTYPTPMGVIRIRHEKQKDGSVKSTIKAPKGVKVVK